MTQYFPEKHFESQILRRGLKNPRLLDAMRTVDRSAFVPEKYKKLAYDDRPLPIAEGQTISQPYIVGYMTEEAHIQPDERVLEIGTGCGYQTAILARMAQTVFTIEIRKELHQEAKKTLESLGIKNIHFKLGNGYEGWPDQAPFDAIIVTAAPPCIPQALKDQLKVGGRMLIPVGGEEQTMLKITRTKTDWKQERLIPVNFVPMVQDHD